ncbi:hypothetical protein CXU22_01670 [Akkermansia muciniphila]|uniref:Uncharacterized protein n=1 Tax=Akkermansia muciniphila TaxID=239935 RepID=A0A2N8HG58_9BACT|nr:hypothetical protein CXU21_06925 [Akkermansia muciniphila]PNC19746.1 hypothetical protein CXU22_01670 [Akkermansia muciniphila]
MPHNVRQGQLKAVPEQENRIMQAFTPAADAGTLLPGAKNRSAMIKILTCKQESTTYCLPFPDE